MAVSFYTGARGSFGLFFFGFFFSPLFFSFVLRLHKFIADSCLSRSHKLSLLIITSFVGSFLYVLDLTNRDARI